MSFLVNTRPRVNVPVFPLAPVRVNVNVFEHPRRGSPENCPFGSYFIGFERPCKRQRVQGPRAFVHLVHLVHLGGFADGPQSLIFIGFLALFEAREVARILGSSGPNFGFKWPEFWVQMA